MDPTLVPEPNDNRLLGGGRFDECLRLREALIEGGVLLAHRDIACIAAERDHGDQVSEDAVRIVPAVSKLLEKKLRERAVLSPLERAILRRGDEIVPSSRQRLCPLPWPGGALRGGGGIYPRGIGSCPRGGTKRGAWTGDQARECRLERRPGRRDLASEGRSHRCGGLL